MSQGTLKPGVDVREATHVKFDGHVERIVSKWGIKPKGGFAKPSEGGFGVVTESGRRVGMMDAQSYLKEVQYTAHDEDTHMSKDPEKVVKVGVGVLIQNALGHILLGLRTGSHAAGEWGAPGGKLEFGDTILRTAEKETFQETSLRVAAIRIICVCEEMRYIPSDGTHFVDIGVLAHYNGGEPQIMEPEKCLEWRWFSIKDLPPNLMESTDYMIRNFRDGTFYRPPVG